MVVKRRGDKWQATVRAPDGTERTASFDKKGDGEKWESINKADIARGQWIDPRTGRIKFATWVEDWKLTCTSLRPSTRERDFGYIDRYLLPTFGRVALAGIDHMMVAKWLSELTSKGPKPWWDEKAQPNRSRKPVSPATAVKATQLLGKIMAKAVKARKVLHNPVDGLDLPKIEREEMRFLNPTEVARMANSISDRYRALVLVGAYSGLRIGELAALRRSRVDLFHRKLQVVETTVEVAGHLHFGKPKTKHGRRTVTLPRAVAKALKAHMGEFTGTEDDSFVFTAPEGGTLRVPAWRRRAWSPAVEDAGLAPLRPHDLRHTAVALWIASGANALAVSRRAGHSSVAFTLDRYGHLFPDADTALADGLEDMAATTSDDASVTSLDASRGLHADLDAAESA